MNFIKFSKYIIDECLKTDTYKPPFRGRWATHNYLGKPCFRFSNAIRKPT